MIDNEEGWRARLRRCGHTGWNDPVVYAWDQPERLRLVERVVRELDLEPEACIALDFGCGVGDFSRMLLRLGFRVIGHDPVARPAIAHPRFHFEPVLESRPRSVDLVLSVTVLDHVLDEARLRATLAALRERLRPGGFLVLLEYSLGGDFLNEPTLRANAHQAFRSRESWRALLASAGFRCQRELPAPHPELAPSPGYARFARDPAVRAVSRLGLAGSRLGRALLDRRARRLAPRGPREVAGPVESPLCCAVLAAGERDQGSGTA